MRLRKEVRSVAHRVSWYGKPAQFNSLAVVRMPPSSKTRAPLARSTLIHIGVRIAVVIALTTLFSYLHMFRVLRTVALNRIRGGWRHLAVVRRYAVTVPGPQAAVEVGPEHVAIVRALEGLDEPQRLVVVLHHLAGLGVEEIAADLGTPVGTVKSRLARARGRLAGLLDEHVDEREEPRHA